MTRSIVSLFLLLVACAVQSTLPEKNAWLQVTTAQQPTEKNKEEQSECITNTCPVSEIYMESESIEIFLYPVNKSVFVPYGASVGEIRDIDSLEDGFFIDKYEVSNEAYSNCVSHQWCQKNKYADDPTFNSPQNPVVGVSWVDAYSYCFWAEKRLPEEYEWEVASGVVEKGSLYPWGDSFFSSERANCGPICHDRYTFTAPIDSMPKGQSFYGVFHLSGNVSEWVGNTYSEKQMVKGGSWADIPMNLVPEKVRWKYYETRDVYTGFRCTKDR